MRSLWPSSQPRENRVNNPVGTRRSARVARDPFDAGCTCIYSGRAGTLDLETLMRLAFAALIAIALLLPDPACAQVVDLSTIKCKDFLDSSKETVAYIMTWLDGYF